MPTRPNRTFDPYADNPALDYYAITPDNATNFASPFRAIYVGVAGNIAVVSAVGSVVTFVGCTAGSILPVEGVRVNVTNTTATSLVGLI